MYAYYLYATASLGVAFVSAATASVGDRNTLGGGCVLLVQATTRGPTPLQALTPAGSAVLCAVRCADQPDASLW